MHLQDDYGILVFGMLMVILISVERAAFSTTMSQSLSFTIYLVHEHTVGENPRNIFFCAISHYPTHANVNNHPICHLCCAVHAKLCTVQPGGGGGAYSSGYTNWVHPLCVLENGGHIRMLHQIRWDDVRGLEIATPNPTTCCQNKDHEYKTRKHSSRIRTAHSSSHTGGIHQVPLGLDPPWDQTPPWDQDPLWDQTPRDQAHRHTPVNIIPCSKLRLRAVKKLKYPMNLKTFTSKNQLAPNSFWSSRCLNEPSLAYSGHIHIALSPSLAAVFLSDGLDVDFYKSFT